jgi:hypothetical protein
MAKVCLLSSALTNVVIDCLACPKARLSIIDLEGVELAEVNLERPKASKKRSKKDGL